jgi:uncharacterized membrane protein YraQ (UPF0718 family)
LIDDLVPDGFIVRVLGKRSKMTLINAVVAGFLMSACSHGILAIAIQRYKMAGVATDYTEVGFLWANIGRRTAIRLPVVPVPQILVVATLPNQFAG